MPSLPPLDQITRMFQCDKGQPEISAFFFIGQNENIIDIHIIGGNPKSLDIPITKILNHSQHLKVQQLLLLHTHPSGDPRPSAADIQATRFICRKLRLQGQRLIDHIILTRRHYFSFRSHKLI